ncbi:MAG TPA: hypothetical protein VKK19_13555 [Candidatus Dormibacteraeota bacterium]|nr:hypothetical protein [Candidatus Dormibacteraeota bacterium]
MTNDSESGGGFGWGLLVGLALGFVAGAALASGPGRTQMETLRARTIELTGTARRVARDPDNPIGRAINDGIAAASRRRQELERTARGRWQERKDAAQETQPDA